MSTRQSIKYENYEDGRRLHLFTDAMDEDDGPVYLELQGVEFEAEYDARHGGTVVVTIPMDMAVKLGLLK